MFNYLQFIRQLQMLKLGLLLFFRLDDNLPTYRLKLLSKALGAEKFSE